MDVPVKMERDQGKGDILECAKKAMKAYIAQHGRLRCVKNHSR